MRPMLRNRVSPGARILEARTRSMTAPSRSSSAAWENLRSLYPVYAALARDSVIDVQACPELEEALDVPSSESVAQAENWFTSIDDRVHPHQLRQFLQNSV